MKKAAEEYKGINLALTDRRESLKVKTIGVIICKDQIERPQHYDFLCRHCGEYTDTLHPRGPDDDGGWCEACMDEIIPPQPTDVPF